MKLNYSEFLQKISEVLAKDFPELTQEHEVRISFSKAEITNRIEFPAVDVLIEVDDAAKDLLLSTRRKYVPEMNVLLG